MARYRLAQFRVTLRRTIVCPPFVERLFGSGDHVWRSIKIRLANLQVDYTSSLGFQCASFYQDLEGALHSKAADSFRKLHRNLLVIDGEYSLGQRLLMEVCFSERSMNPT
jgi:hypothetical protein